ncbi:MAG: hypothetical protein IJZ79_03295 [Bacilli bacterium]|nr:hypothetical protein [Bacilli bacterium]MBQ8218753.1 hypothetical protein [Bacilli bacterium]
MGKRIDHTGEIGIASNGMQIVIKDGSKGNRKLTIEFSDGVIVYNKSYHHFTHGSIVHPTVKSLYLQNIYNSHIGETIVDKYGQTMTIIDFRFGGIIDVQFSDKTVVTNKLYTNFKNANIRNPNYHKPIIDIRLNESKISKCGLNMTIIKGIPASDITVKFESGYIAEHKAYNNFKKGRIGHPFPYKMSNIILEKPAYIHNNVGNFYCTCANCGYRDIWTINEAKNHKCEEIAND